MKCNLCADVNKTMQSWDGIGIQMEGLSIKVGASGIPDLHWSLLLICLNKVRNVVDF